MGGEKHRPARPAQLAQELLEGIGRVGVQAYEGFVQQQQPGLADQGRDQGQLLLHAVAVAAHLAAQVGGEGKGVRIAVDALGARPGRDGADIRNKVEVLDAGKEIVQVGVVGQKGHSLLGGHRLGADGMAGDGDLALRKIQHAGHRPQRGRFARAVVAQKAVYLAGRHVQGQVLHGVAARRVLLGKMVDAEHMAPPFR